ncbi:MAG: D-alanine--D-alanine ligase [Phycisphaerales bacterium]|nr:MAG: D-alanine--D-alanine ligase [Phycisphaerales bacterium]
MQENRPTVLVLKGGPDAEREVSLLSGSAVADALRETGRFNVHDRTIDRPAIDDLRATVDSITAADADCPPVIFPVLHGHWGEGGPLQELLEQLGLPYVGSRPGPAARAMDKLLTKMLIGAESIPTPPARQLMPEDECDLDPPLVLKPVDDGSSVDMRICHTSDQVAQGRRELHSKRGRLMAERYIRGRELTVGILSGRALPLIEIVPASDAVFYDYAAKYERDDTRYLIDPDVPAGIGEKCSAWAVAVFNRLGCRDLARVDFMLDEAGPWFLEINTMPGFTGHSLVPMAAGHIGMDMPALCTHLVEAALARTAPPVPSA